MTPNPIFMSQLSNMNKARKLMVDKKIRHIPIKDSETGKLIGMLSQKSVLANTIKIINQKGLDQLEHVEKSMDIGSVMNTSPAAFEVSGNLLDIANSLIKQRSGCVAITQNEELVGVITSNDFVKLTISQLSQSEE